MLLSWQTRQSIGRHDPQRIPRPQRKIRSFGEGWHRGFSKFSMPVGGMK